MSQAANALVAIVNFKETFITTFLDATESMYSGLAAQGFDQNKIDQLRIATRNFGETIADDSDMNSRMVELNNEAFTEEEIWELLSFYETPLGKKSIEMIPMIMAKASALGEEVASRHLEKYQAEIEAILSAATSHWPGSLPVRTVEALRPLPDWHWR